MEIGAVSRRFSVRANKRRVGKKVMITRDGRRDEHQRDRNKTTDAIQDGLFIFPRKSRLSKIGGGRSGIVVYAHDMSSERTSNCRRSIVPCAPKEKNSRDIRNNDFNGIIRSMLKREFRRTF